MTYVQASNTHVLGMAESQNPFDMGGSAPAAEDPPAAEAAGVPDQPAPGALDANLFATPAADSYNPAGTGAQAPEDECMIP